MRRSSTADVPEIVPALSRGKHRSPRKGACFMEMASYLAGERWSDHPRCTHPLVASVARMVNDHTSDESRSRLTALIPSVIGLTSTDPRVDARIALRCATTALPIVPAEQQSVMAVSVFAAERALASLDGREPGELQPASIAALDRAPHAAAWARGFVGRFDTTATEFSRNAAPHIVRIAVQAIADSTVSDPDTQLYDLLAGVIDDCSDGHDTAPVTPVAAAHPVTV